MTENDLPSLPSEVILSIVECSVLVTINSWSVVSLSCSFPAHFGVVAVSACRLPSRVASLMRQKSDKITMLSEYRVGEEVATVHIQDINQPATILDVNPELHIKCIDVLFCFPSMTIPSGIPQSSP